MSSRYAHVGRIYDVVSLEWPLYRRPRLELMDLLGARPGSAVVDVGCGTGLNLAHLRRLVAPNGTVVGLDTSPSMLAVAGRRVRRAGWEDVQLLRGDAADIVSTLRASGVDPGAVEAVVATFVVSLLPDEEAFWASIDEMSAHRPVRVALADLGEPRRAPVLARPVLRTLTRVGGGDPSRRPWDQLARRAPDTVHRVHLGGHVHLAAGTCGPAPPHSARDL